MDGSRVRTRRGILGAVAALWLIAAAVLMFLLKDAPRGESLLDLVGFSLAVPAGVIVFLAALLWVCWLLFRFLPRKVQQWWVGRKGNDG